MGRFTSILSFNRGEVAPEFVERTDTEFYERAVRKLDNFFPLPAGGITTRPPLLPVIMSLPMADAGFTVAPQSATFMVEEVKGALLWAVFAWVYNSEAPQLYKIRVRYGRLARTAEVWGTVGTTGTVDVTAATASATLFGSVITNGVGLPSLAKEITRSTAGPAVFIASSRFPPARLFFSTGGEADFQTMTFFEELLGLISVTSNSTAVTGVDTIFQDQLAAGGTLRIRDVSYTVLAITSQNALTLSAPFVGLTQAGLRVTKPKAAPFGAGQNPALVTFHKNRLAFFTTSSRPTGFWASRPNDPFTILPGSVHDDAPIDVDLFADGVDSFRWIASLNHIFLGTSAGEYAVLVPGDGPMTPTSFSFIRLGATGGEAVRALPLQGGVVHVARASGQVMHNQFDFARQGFTSADLSLFAPHLLTAAVRSMAYRSPRRDDPAGRFFVTLEDGTLRVFSFNEAQGIQAWSRFTLADPSMQTLVDVGSLSDAVFPLLTRNGALMLCALKETRSVVFELDYATAVSPTAPGSRLYNVAGFPLLTARQVAVFSATFGYLGVFTTTATTLDLNGSGVAVEDITIGVPYTAEVSLLPAVVEDNTGSSQNRRKRLIRTIVSVRETYQLELNQKTLLGDVAPIEGGNIPSFTGTLEQRHLGWFTQEDSRASTLGIYPATILSLTREVGV